MNKVKYIVVDGDRWDSIAAKAYGQPERWPEIAAANPAVALTGQPTVGAVLWVPVIDAVETSTTTVEGLPPWRR